MIHLHTQIHKSQQQIINITNTAIHINVDNNIFWLCHT